MPFKKMTKLSVAKPVQTVILMVVAAVILVADAAKNLVLHQLPSLRFKGVGSKNFLLPHFFVRFNIKVVRTLFSIDRVVP
jgi:hypothetical protein